MPRKSRPPTNDLDQLKGMNTREALAYWLALPTKARNPRTQKGLAELMGVSEERLCQIKRDPEFQTQVQDFRKDFFRQFTSNVIEAVKKSAIRGNDKAAKLFLQYVEDFKETTKQEQSRIERREFVFMLPDEKLAELKQIIELQRHEEELKIIDAEVIPKELPCANTPPDKT